MPARILIILLTVTALVASASADTEVTPPPAVVEGELDPIFGIDGDEPGPTIISDEGELDPIFAGAEGDSASAPAALVPPAGGDVRRVRGGGAARLVAAVPSVRVLGSGWVGHSASVARTTFPAAFTEVTLGGRWAGDWVGGGLHMADVSFPAAGTPVVESGHDLSRWPVLTTGSPVVSTDGLAPLPVDFRHVRVPGSRPFSRFTMTLGAFDRQVMAAEFGRRYLEGRTAVAILLETESGSGPVYDGEYEIERTGAAVSARLTGGWTAELSGLRADVARRRPFPGHVPPAADVDNVTSDVRVRLSNDRVVVETFHGRLWRERGLTAGTLTALSDGIFAAIGDVGPLDAVRVQFERRAADGEALDRDVEELLIRGEATRRVAVGEAVLTASGGLGLLGGVACPHAGLSLAPGGGSRDWRLDASLTSRAPTVTERYLSPYASATFDGGVASVAGNAVLEQERALLLSGTHKWTDFLSGVGVRADVVHVVGPVVLEERSPSAFRPANAPDETGGAVSLWAAVGESTGLTGAVLLDARAIDPDGALNALAPVAAVSGILTVSAPWSLFEDYLSTRWEASLEIESGLARGPWSDLVEDTRTSLSLAVTGTAGSARVFAAVEDVLGTDSARLPGLDPGGTRLSVGFSWRFWD